MEDSLADFTKITEAVERQTKAFDVFIKSNDDRFDSIEARLGEMQGRIEESEAKASAPARPASARPQTEHKVVPCAGGENAYAVTGKGRLSDIPELQHKTDISLDRWARALVFGDSCEDKEALAYLAETKNVNTGSTGVLIPAGFVPQWIDMARAQSVLSRAGMRTVTMPAQTLTYSHQTGDPTFSWRSSEGSSLTASDPTFATRQLSAKTLAVRTQVSLEAAQDIPNFGEQITAAYSKAFGAAIDLAGLTGSGSAPTGLINTPGVNTVAAGGTPANWDKIVDGVAEHLGANNTLESVSGMIFHPDLWKVFAKLKTGISSDNTPLDLPPAIANIPRFVTSNLQTANSPQDYVVPLGDFSALVMGVRMNPTIRILDATTSMASNLLVEIVGVARIDFLAVRPASFTLVEGFTTG